MKLPHCLLEWVTQGGDENLIKIAERRSRLRSREPGHRYGTFVIIIRFEKHGMGICNGKISSSGTSVESGVISSLERIRTSFGGNQRAILTAVFVAPRRFCFASFSAMVLVSYNREIRFVEQRRRIILYKCKLLSVFALSHVNTLMP